MKQACHTRAVRSLRKSNQHHTTVAKRGLRCTVSGSSVDVKPECVLDCRFGMLQLHGREGSETRRKGYLVEELPITH